MLNRDADMAQDFVQELFLKILEKKHQFDPNKKFYTWVFTVASNMCKTAYRSNGRSVAYETAKHENISVQYGENRAEKELFKQALEVSIMQLEEHHKQAFVLRYLEQFSLNEIADIAEISVGTVKSRLFYATKIVTKDLEAFDPSLETSLFKLS